MKTKSYLLSLFLFFPFLCLNLTAQISSPNGTVNTTTNPATGNVGIGTSTPNSKLEVVGDLKATKAIFPGKELNDEVFTDWNDGIEKSVIFSAGKTIPGSSNIRLFSMHDMSMGSPYDLNGVFFSIYDRNGKKRFNVDLLENSSTELVLKDQLQSEFFKVKDYGDSKGAYVQIPKSNTKFIIGGYSDDPIIGTHKFVVKGSSLIQGNIITDSSIGIGTATPSAKLHITDLGTSGETTLQLNNRMKFRGDGVFEWGASSNQGILSWDTGRAVIGAKSGQDLSLYANSSEKIRINQNGNVGIGTTDTKGFKLGVEGKIAATEVKVATYANWADYVFNKDYNLPTLREVEQHIKENGHLKDIPSAEDVEKDGFFLGNMDSKLLQKIEELTLYTIEQQKEIEAQSNEIEKLKKEKESLQSLSKRLADIEVLLNNQKE